MVFIILALAIMTIEWNPMAKQKKQTLKPMTAMPSRMLNGDVRVPGDKSISHRSLMIASQAIGSTEIEGMLEGEDVIRTAKALRALGVQVNRHENGRWQVQGVGIGGLKEPSDVLDMGNSGTSTRLLMGLVSTYDFCSFFTGDASLRKRPMLRAMTPLGQMGANFMSRGGNRLPLVVRGAANTKPIIYESPIASAQVKSAIMLAALNTRGRTTIIEPMPSRDHSERMLTDFGVEVETRLHTDGRFEVSLEGCQEIWVKDKLITVPGDPSSAAFVVAAAILCPDSRVTVRGVCINPLRVGFYETLKEMGAKLEFSNIRTHAGEEVADISISHGRLKAVEVPAERAPSMIDEYPMLAVLASFADGVSRMHGLSELRVKESNRLAAICAGLAANGVRAEEQGDSLIVYGCGGIPKGGGRVETHLDHRIAMSFLIMGLASHLPVTVDDISAIATSFPEFMPLMQAMGAVIEPESTPVQSKDLPEFREIKPMVIAIDGPAASGKGTLARRLASYLGFAYLDTGRLYRATALRLVNTSADHTDEDAAAEAAAAVQEEDLLNPKLRAENIGKIASYVSAMPKVRAALLEWQRNFARRTGGAILDGRDIGTVVCPSAEAKLFITASQSARAHRRWLELSGMGVDVSEESVLREIETRDARDSERAAAPLKPAEGAMVIDTTDIDPNDVFQQALEYIGSRD